MKKTLAVAAVCFFAPIAIAFAMNPQATKQNFNNAIAWAQKTFPVPEPTPDPPVRRG